MKFDNFLAVFILLCTTANFSLAQSSMQQSYQLPSLYNDNNDEFTVIAHRGASAYYPENTMAAFRAAVDMKAEMIELDVLLSKDGVPVVIHDAILNRTTGGRGPVIEFTADELQELDAGSWFDASFAGEHVPTLEEVLQFASGKIALNIEIKSEAVSDKIRGGIEEKCLSLVKRYDMQYHVLFSSFNYRAVAHLRSLDSNIPVAILYNKRQYSEMLPSALLNKYKADAFNCSFRQLSKGRLTDLKKHKIPAFVYTVNEKSRMRMLIQKGVNGIFTNKPDLLLSLINNLNRDGRNKNKHKFK